MKLIIDIPDDVYADIQHGKGEYINSLNWAVRNGIPYKESPQTIGCFNCKYNGLRMSDDPCGFCDEQHSEWEKKNERR